MQNVSVWVTIVVYVIGMALISVVTGRKAKSVADITVGGRNAGAWLSALSYGTAYFSAVMFVGYAGGTGLKFGLWGILAGLGNAVFGSWLAWKLLARRTRDISRRLKIKTMPQLLEVRYSSRALKLFACVVMFVFLVPYSASVYQGLASVAEVLLGIDAQIVKILIAVVAALLLVFGGYLAQARADFAQGIIMMFGVALLIVCVVRSEQVGGITGLMDYAHNNENALRHLSGSEWVSLMGTVLMTSFGTWGLPQMVQKYFGIRDDKQAKRGIAISTFFAVLVAGGGYFIGSLCHRFFVLNKESVAAMGGQDYIVPNMLKAAQIPNVLLGIVLVLLIAASVSTLCSVTLTASSISTVDFFKTVSKTKMSDKKLSLMTRLVCVIFVFISYIVANTDTPILDMMSYSWGIISGSFLAPYVISLFWKGVNLKGAWASVLGGFCVAAVPATCKIINLCGVRNETVISLAGKGPVFAVVAMLTSIALILIVSAASNGFKKRNNNEFFYNGVVEAE